MYESNVTINQKMYIKRADDSFLKYTGIDMSASVMKAVHPEDRDRFRNAVEDLKLDGIPQNMVFVRLKNNTGAYIWATVNMQYESYDLEHKLIQLNVSEWNEVKNHKKSYEEQQQKADNYQHEDYQSRLLNDIREDKSYDADMDKDAGLDILNKRAITEYAHKVIEKKVNNRNYFIIFDMDHFKTVNDSYGHMFGDEVLVTVAGIIKNIVNSRGLVGRIGGDEILIVTNSVEDRTELKNMLRSIRTTVEWTYKGKNPGISLTCSMGVAAFPDNGDNYEDIFNLADKMLYLAKNKGRNRYIIFTPELHKEYVNNTKKNTAMAGTGLAYGGEDRLGIMQLMIENYLVRQTMTNEALFAQIGEAFDMDEILLIYDDETVGFQWTKESVCSNIHELRWFETDEAFQKCFNAEGLFLIHGMDVIEENIPDRKKDFEAHNVRAAMFYQFKRNGKHDGIVMFGRKEQRGKWSEYEVLAFTMIAKIFEVSVR